MSPSNHGDALFAAECCARVRTLANSSANSLRKSQSLLDRWISGQNLKSAKVLMSLANALEAIHLGLPAPEPSEDNARNESTVNFLLGLENLCRGCTSEISSGLRTVRRGSIRYPYLEKLYEAPAPFTKSEISADIMENLVSFAEGDSKIIQSFLSNIKSFAEKIIAACPDPAERKLKPTEIEVPLEYPRPVNKRLYDTLYESERCTCAMPSSCLLMRHCGGIRLKECLEIVDDHVVFETVFSTKIPSNPTDLVDWRHLRFHIPSSERSSKKATVSQEELDTDESKVRLQGEVDKSKIQVFEGHSLANAEASIPDFCKFLQHDIGPASRGLRVHGKELRQLGSKGWGQYVLNEPGISLNRALGEKKLTTKDRAILAYILARSIWQYYGSDWTQTRWTADSIVFMKEEVDNVMDTDINAAIPYFTLLDPDQRNREIQVREYLDNLDTSHKYPLVLTLGMLLVEICRNGCPPNPIDEATSLVKRINTDRARYWHMATRDKGWPYMDTGTEFKNTYKKIVLKCLDNEIFQNTISPEDRRDVVFKDIVFPLKQLLMDLKWIDSSGNVVAYNSNSEGECEKQQSIETLDPLDQASNIICKESQEWLEKIQKSSFCHELCRGFQKNRKTMSRIKIAILDTGFDKTSNFFKDEVRVKRIDAWQDFVDGTKQTLDEDGHGTCVLSLAMKVAPSADMLVARIAKDSNALRYDKQKTSKRIEKAIEWAVEKGADIISMSFGWVEEAKVDGKDVISDAILAAKLKRKILFFAAASNYGASKSELFPAQHEIVSSIRATDTFGTPAFFSTPPGNSIAFGTLGLDVPCARLSSTKDEISMSGTSMATPIAAGIAALVLGFARLQVLTDDNPERSGHWDKLWTKVHMEQMFEEISRSTLVAGLRFLDPDHFVKSQVKDADRTRMMENAIQPPK